MAQQRAQSNQAQSTRGQDRQSEAATLIRERLAQWKQAMEAKDAPRVLSFYSEDAVMFSLAPPLRERGLNQQALQAWFDTWKGGLKYEMREDALVADEDVAYCHSLTRMTGTKTSGDKNDIWFRATACLRRIEGQWQITHEHTSVPFQMDGSLKAAVDLKP